MVKQYPSSEILNELLLYDEVTGKLFWKARDIKWFKSLRDWKAWNKRYSNKEAFPYSPNGKRREGTFLGKHYQAHKLIFIIKTKNNSSIIDHKNRNASDNSWDNLRNIEPGSKANNSTNLSKRKDNRSGYHGVYYIKDTNKWCVQIYENKKRTNIGIFNCWAKAIKQKIQEEKRMGYLKHV